MLFNSWQFAIFFPVVTLAYFGLPHRTRWAWLLAASAYFYAVFVPAFLAILGLSIVIDYVAGIVIEDASPKLRRPALIVSLLANIGLLAIFKYGAFAWENVSMAASWFGADLPMIPRLMLPIGLSFHTFQAMSYTIEVYRGRQRAERHLGVYALYVMFYPQLVAGPIERPQNLLHQFREPHAFDYDRVRDGLLRMAWGLIKKVVIADRLAAAADAVFDLPTAHSGLAPALGVICFGIQIYCDFSGYSDIAIGAASVMGFTLMENFQRPYFARSIPEFWSRWHISLSTWFKDYVYIPLGGNRVGAPRRCANLLIVFLISGLWHGANWTFVVWGAYHGILMILAVLLGGRVRLPDIVKRLSTFALVSVGWVFFRADSLSAAVGLLSQCTLGVAEVLRGYSSTALWTLPVPAWEIVLCIGALLAIEAWQQLRNFEIRKLLLGMSLPVRWAAYEAAILLLVFFGHWGSQAFIYFQF
jgi:alginate O-acetyltransferase complex protein AlgI